MNTKQKNPARPFAHLLENVAKGDGAKETSTSIKTKIAPSVPAAKAGRFYHLNAGAIAAPLPTLPTAPIAAASETPSAPAARLAGEVVAAGRRARGLSAPPAPPEAPPNPKVAVEAKKLVAQILAAGRRGCRL